MNFTTPQRVIGTIQAGDQVERARAENRIKVNDLFNAAPPLTDAEAEKIGLHINVNWGEGTVLAHHGRRQYNTAFLQPSNFFKIKLPCVARDDEPKRVEWELWLTQAINSVLKDSLAYFEVFRQKFASVVSHGIGPQMWFDDEDWMPQYVAVEDLRMPTDTELSMRNLVWFAVRKTYTPGELADKVWGDDADPHWNKPAIHKMLAPLGNQNVEEARYNWNSNPEKMAERLKQDLGYWSSDAVPTIPLWHFYYVDKKKWYLKIVPSWDAANSQTLEFLYDSKDPVADKLQHLLHIQFGDLSSKAPFMYHSVRSLGNLLVEPCFWTNLTRCRFLQHVMEAFNIWLRSSDPQGKSRAQKLELFDRCWIPEGVTVVPQTERHQIDPRLVEGALSEMRQLMQEAASSYTQDIDSGTSKEKTATETMALMQKVNALMGGLLATAFMYERFHYKEVCRRFCLRNTQNPDARRFQEQAEAFGIPKVYVNVEMWQVEPEMPLGNGNPTMELLQAQQLMQARGAMGPEAQQEILHLFIAATTGNWELARRLAPLGGNQGISAAAEHAELAFSTLMLGVPVRGKSNLNPMEQIETLLGLMAGVIARIEKYGNMARVDELVGLQTVAGYINELIQAISQDEANTPRIKNYTDSLGKLMNTVKAFGQRLAEQQAQQQQAAQGDGANPQAQMMETAAKTQSLMATTKAKIDAKNAESEQKRRQEALDFELEQHRKDREAAAEEHRREMQARGEESRRERQAQGDEQRKEVQAAGDEARAEKAAATKEDKGGE